MNWDDKYLLNEHTIDSHHKKLIQVMSILEDKQTLPKDDFLKTLSFLYEYATHHFEYEEKQMAKFNYPQMEVHKKMHKVFLDKINNWINEFNTLPPIVNYNEVRAVFQFGIAWLYRHILTTDRKFVDFLNSKNL